MTRFVSLACGWIALLLVSTSPCLAQQPAAKEAAAISSRQPNIILITIDDLGYADIGPFGGKVPTPHLDRMAKEGLRLTSHYAAPVCSPSRAALMTGCYPKRCLPTPHVLFPAGAVGLNPEEVTIAEVLKSVGYQTACIGKWHLGDQPEFLPTRQGFGSYYGIPYSNDMGLAAEGSKSNRDRPLPNVTAEMIKKAREQKVEETGLRGDAQPPLPMLKDETVVGRVGAIEQATFTQEYTQRAVRFINDQRDGKRPYFLYLPHNAVHWPHYPAPDFVGRSKSTLLADWIMEMDANVGQLIDAVRSSGQSDNTLVLFMSDNGGALPQGSNNTPLRGSKGSTLEGGIRVCALAWWPGRVTAGSSTEAITSNMDILPTCAALAGAKLNAERKIDGIDLADVLFGRSPAGKTVGREAFHYFRGFDLEAVRLGPWKLQLAKGQLYDLKSDPGEAKNVADEQPEIVAKLRKLAAEMDADLGAKQLGSGVRPLGRVKDPQPLIDWDGKVRPGFEPKE